MGDRNQECIFLLANMMAGKQVETGVIDRALLMICREFFFDCGLVYDIDQFNRFNLRERFTDQGAQTLESFARAEISPEYLGILAKETVTFIRKDSENTPLEKQLLQLFPTEKLMLLSVVDEKLRIYGFLVFLGKRDVELPTGADKENLTVLLTMLGRYTCIRMYQNKVSFAQNSLERVLDNTGIDIYVNDFINHDILYVNKSMAAPYGGISQFLGNKCWEVLFPGQGGPCEFCPQKKLIDEYGNPTKVYSWDYQRARDGLWFRVFSAAFRWVDGRLAHVVSSADITDNKNNEQLVHYMAHYDALTNLPNRRMLINDCQQKIVDIKKNQSAYLLFFDIDGFKSINDSYGHDAGDEFLMQLGAFFTSLPRLKGNIYRNGGDEFVALLDGDVQPNDIRRLSDEIQTRFLQPWKLKAGEARCGVSVGVACYPKDGDTPEALLYQADQAMYRIKKSGGGGLCFFSN